jgi:hypothetical protein
MALQAMNTGSNPVGVAFNQSRSLDLLISTIASAAYLPELQSCLLVCGTSGHRPEVPRPIGQSEIDHLHATARTPAST